MTRRPIWLLGVLSFSALVLADTALADGLYKGRGRRTHDYAWSFRANGSVGFHGVEDPWDQFRVSSYPIAGYANFGVEFALPGQHSIEIQSGYYWVNDSQNIVALGSPPELPRPGTYRYEVSSWSAGMMYRFWMPRGTTATYIGMGGAWVVAADLEYREDVSGSDPYRASASGAGPQVNFAFGYEGVANPTVRIGMELGFRYSWVNYDNGIYGAGNFNGIYLGFRLGLVGGGD